MQDQLDPEAEIMSGKELDLNKVTISRRNQLDQDSTTMPLDLKERRRKLCFALLLLATAASRTKQLTSRISTELIEFKEATRNLFSLVVDFMIGRLEASTPVRNTALSRVVLGRKAGEIHLMGSTVGE